MPDAARKNTRSRIYSKWLWRALQGVGFSAFAVYRIWVASASKPAVWNDSEAYLAVSRHSIASTAMWTGPRAPLVPLFLKLTGGYRGYGIAEAIVGVLAWGLLAFVMSRLVAPGVRRFLMFLSVLAFATAPLVVQWDWSVLSESPSLSALAVMLAIGLLLVRRFTWVRLGGLTLAAAAYVGLRDADIWDVGMVGLGLLVFGLAGTIRGGALNADRLRSSLWLTVKAQWIRTRRPIAVGTALFMVALGAGIAADASHRNVLNVEEAFYVRIFPYPDRVAWFASRGMPMAPAINTLAQETPAPAPGNAKLVEPNWSQSTWAPLQEWFRADGLTTYAVFLFTHPVYVVSAPFEDPPLTFNNASGDLSFYLPIGHLKLDALETVFIPNRVIVGVLAALAMVLASFRRLARRREWMFLAIVAALGLVSMLLAWHGEGQEVTRHMVEGMVEVRLGVLLALMLALLGQPASGVATEDPPQPSAPLTDPLDGNGPAEP